MSKKTFGKSDASVTLPLAGFTIGRRGLSGIAASLVAAAGVSHLLLVPEHSDVLILAAFFAAVGLFQLALGGLFIFSASKRVYGIAALSSAFLIGLYFLSRYVAIPIGHHAEPEPVDGFGLLVKSAEAGLLIPLFYLLRAVRSSNGNRDGRNKSDAQLQDTSGKRIRSTTLILIGLLVGMVFGFYIAQPQFTELFKTPVVMGQNIREYTLIVEPKQMKVGDKVWEVWAYNGTVPAPTLKGKVGEILKIKLINKHNMTHSIHTHLRGYKFEMDGSQANIIAGKGAGSMVPPGGQYVYEFPLTTPGIYYFHCHSSDGGRTISEHIHRGLYGAIIVDEPDRPPAKEFVLFYSDSQPGNPAPFTINNRGIPGGEMVLMELFKQKGFAGVAEQLNVTVTAIKVQKDDVVRLHIINIGDIFHSHHHHGFEHRSIRTLRGDAWAAALLPLMPGQADTLEFRAVESGLWLMHCHVVSHADAGMIAVLIVE